MQARAFVHTTRPGDFYRAGRTLRSLCAAGIAAESIAELNSQKLSAILEVCESVLFVRSGAWLVSTAGFRLPHPSATGKGLCAFGMVRDLNEGQHSLPAIPGPLTQLVPCIYLDARAVQVLAGRGVESLAELFCFALEQLRLVHVPSLDVYDDRGLRVLQLITALQRGGAERVTLDLMAELPARDMRVRLATLGRPLREAFPTPPGTLELARVPGNAGDRAMALLWEAVSFGADVIHGHLIAGDDAARISQGGFPLVLTMHNMRQGWPRGMAELAAGDAALIAACAQAVERDVLAAKLPVPVRAVQNGIDLSAFIPTPARLAVGRKLRQDWGFGDEDFVMVGVANLRPQKRLRLMPAILAGVRAQLGASRQARLVFCGEALPGNAESERCEREIRTEIARLQLDPHVRWTGSVADVSEVLAAANALVSTSAHEGLSLAQPEALAMGLRVVATDVGGAREIARESSRFRLLPADASPDQFARELASIAAGRSGGNDNETQSPKTGEPLKSFSRREMAARYRRLYPRAIAAATRAGRGEGLWLVANNFSTGGAQSSARRLLAGFAARGLRVRAAVVEEDPAHPTPGRAALLRAGIPVLALLPGFSEMPGAIGQLLEAIDTDPPRAVVFWNLRPSFKIPLADALLDVPVFDVSPGEMFFDSLDAYYDGGHCLPPYRNARDYGARLAGVVVKYRAEAARAAHVLGAPVHVIPNGVPLDPLPLGGFERPDSQCPMAFATAARINPQKRLEDLLEAFRFAHDRLPAYTLRIAGGVERGCDDYAARLRHQSRGLPVEWLGEVSDVRGFHRQSDLFVMISEPAGCPNASLEAMAAALPIVATDVGGASEQVIDRRTGRLVPPRNPRAFAEAVVELAAQPALRQDMGIAARNLVRERFDVERMVADYRRVFLPED